MSRRPPRTDSLQKGAELGNESRNERQKSKLLCEVGRIRRGELDSLIETSKEIIDRSKKLCQPSTPAPTPSRRKKRT